jgi:hypothetical protein
MNKFYNYIKSNLLIYSKSNRITRDGAKHLSEYLKKDTPLKSLDLSYNRIEDDGAKYIAEALMFANSTLQKYIYYNIIMR